MSNIQHLLEMHQLTEKPFAAVSAYLADKGFTLRSVKLVDTTIIDAPSSTKNKAKVLDPETSETKKCNDSYFGMEARVGVDVDSGIGRSMGTTTAKNHDGHV